MQPARKDAPLALATAPRKILFVEGSAGGVVGGSPTGVSLLADPARRTAMGRVA